MKSSPCLSIKRKNDDVSLLSLYVDDGRFATSDADEKGKLMSFLAQRFSMKELGPLHYFIGMEVIDGVVSRTIRMHQNAFIVKMLRQYGMDQCSSVKPPWCHLLLYIRKGR